MSPNNGLARVGMGTKSLQEGKYQEAIGSLAQGEFPHRPTEPICSPAVYHCIYSQWHSARLLPRPALSMLGN